MTIADRIKVGIALPQAFVPGPVDMGEICRFVARAEALGFESLWTQEAFLGAGPGFEPLHLLSYVAALTSRARLGVSVIVMARHNPVQLARRLATLDYMSSGRLDVGIGVGGPYQAPGLGLPGDKAVRRLTEGLGVMKALWTQEHANYQGQMWQLKDLEMDPKPVQEPHPPVWFGAGQPDALRRAVRLGDGWMGAGASSRDEFVTNAALVRRYLADEGRDSASFGISKRVYLAIDDDAARAERRLREWFGAFYGNPDMGSRVGVWGTPGQVAERVEELIDAGAQHLLLQPVFDHMEHLEALAELTGLR